MLLSTVYYNTFNKLLRNKCDYGQIDPHPGMQLLIVYINLLIIIFQIINVMSAHIQIISKIKENIIMIFKIILVQVKTNVKILLKII
jgi:hypothetical protein